MNHTTRTFPRTTQQAFGLDATEATAIHYYRTPLHKRVLFFLIRHGWLVIIPAIIAAIIMEIA